MANGAPSPAAQRLAGRAADLDALRGVPADTHDKAIVAALKQHGMICEGCGHTIEVGFHFYRLDVGVRGGKTIVSTHRIAACSRDDCDFAERAREGAHVVEMREFRWLGSPLATPPAAERASRAAE